MTAQSINKGWFQSTTEYLNQVLGIGPTKAEKHMESEIWQVWEETGGRANIVPYYYIRINFANILHVQEYIWELGILPYNIRIIMY